MRTTSISIPDRQLLHPVNSAAFLAKGEKNVKPEEMFFFNYFKVFSLCFNAVLLF